MEGLHCRTIFMEPWACPQDHCLFLLLPPTQSRSQTPISFQSSISSQEEENTKNISEDIILAQRTSPFKGELLS
jgi:hypothetical protein